MLSSQKKYLGIIVASLLLATITYILIMKGYTVNDKTPSLSKDTIIENLNSRHEKSVSDVAFSKNSQSTLIINHTNTEKPDYQIKLWNQFNNAEDAAQAQNTIDTAYKEEHDDLAKSLEHKLHGQCAYPKSILNANYKDGAWIIAKLKDYCSSYTQTISHEELLARLSTQPSKKKLLLKEKLKSSDDYEKMQVIADAIINAQSEGEIASIYTLWHQILKINPSASLSKLKYLYDWEYGQGFPDIYYASFDLYSCYKFGGCEANQYNSLDICGISGGCQPGWSVYDYYENNLSSNELGDVVIILQYIFDQQTSN